MTDPDPLLVPKRRSSWSAVLIFLGIAACMVPLVWAIIMPVFKQVSTSKQTELCLMNLRSIGAGLLLYAEATDGRLPYRDVGWMDSLTEYVNGDLVFACPVQRRMDPRTYGYAMNEDLVGKPLKSIPDHTKAPVVFDSNRIERNAFAGIGSLPDPGRHANGRKNSVLFLDGRTEALGRL